LIFLLQQYYKVFWTSHCVRCHDKYFKDNFFL